MSFSARLKKLREESNIRQEDLAAILNISRQAISNYEQGTRLPKDEKILFLIADYFNVSIDFLLGRDLKPAAASWFNEKKGVYQPRRAVLLEKLQREAEDLPDELLENVISLIEAIKKAGK